MRQKGAALVIILAIIAVVAVGTLAYLAGKMNLSVNISAPTPVATSSNQTPAPATPTPSPDVTANWQVYTNSQYGFQIKYPGNFQALTDSNNLYGWPNAVVLFYSGGQSYDLPVEVWNTQAQYQAKYPSGTTVFTTSGGKFITLTNVNHTPEVDQIIATFKFTP
jgi:hypothetical protein